MSIYIKGMEMPTNCFDCPCVEAEFMECAAKEHLSLPKDEYGAALGEVPNWCPLIPVPEHGDLIDTRPFDVLSFHNPEPGYENTFMDGVLWMEDKIDNAPVVRCADCKWFQCNMRQDGYLPDGVSEYECRHWCGPCDPTDYCSHGAKMEVDDG